MIEPNEAILLFSGWRDDGSNVRAVLQDSSDEVTRCVIEGKISKVDNALLEIRNAREGMTVNIAGALFEYCDSREFGGRASTYSDMIRTVLASGMRFALAVMPPKTS